jgi:hypothetical protein
MQKMDAQILYSKLAGPVSNGTGSPNGAPDWRECAMHAALRIEAEDGQSEDALLAEIRQYRPGCATIMCWLDRRQLLAFLEIECDQFAFHLRGSDNYYGWDDQEEILPYVGWHMAVWRGLEVEVILSPGTNDTDPSICVANDSELLAAFVRAASKYASRPSGRCLRNSSGWAGAPDMDEEIGDVNWDDIILAPDTATQLRHAVEGFIESRVAFEALGFPWRRGILLVGPPGTGKTMVCKAAAASLPDLPFLYVRDLGERRDREAIRCIFARARSIAPCILAFEDLDGFVTDSNRTVFLNEMDGFRNNDGLLIIASSNHPGKIDEALLRRPSRFDRVFHLGPPALMEREVYCLALLARDEMAQRIHPEVDAGRLASETAAQTDGFTPAFLKELFISAALRCAQNGALVLDGRFVLAVREQIGELRAQMRKVKNPDALTDVTSSCDAIGLRRHAARSN